MLVKSKNVTNWQLFLTGSYIFVNRSFFYLLKSGLTEINIDAVRTLIKRDCSLTCQEMAAVKDYSKSTIEIIIRKLDVRCVVSTWILHHLMKRQFLQRVDVCASLKNK